MAYTQKKSQLATNEKRVRSGDRTTAFWVPYSQKNSPYAGIEKNGASATENKPIGIMCTLVTLPDVIATPINERQIFSVGKNRVTLTDGYTIDPFDVETFGNDVASLFSMVSQDSATNKILKHQFDYDLCGALILLGHDNEGNGKRCDVIVDLKCKILQVPGASDGDSTQQIKLWSDNAKIYSSEGSLVAAVEVFRQNAGGTITTPATTLPDGIITAFPVGAGNSSQGGTPTVIQIDSTATGAATHFMKILHNDSDITETATFAQPNVTISPAPAANDTLLFMYWIDTATDQIPLGLTPTSVMSMYYGWPQYLALS